MYASAMFNYRARNSTKSSKIASERGLMPRGMGDCGMMNNGDYYGVFYPHNCLAVAADGQVLEAAKILGKTEDVPFLTQVYEQAKEALLISIRENLVEIDGYRVIPPVAHAPITSMYGCLYSCFPGNLICGDDPIIADTVRYLEHNKMSEGGLPIGMGWMKQGLWVAMALSNLARAYLRMGLYKEARKYLYPALNHASPFVTWCEERGAEKDSAQISGDKQHLWTPLSICQYLTEALFFEDEEAVHVCAGACPEWLSEGKEISVKGFYSHYGKTDFAVRNVGGEYTFDIKTERKIEKEICLHLPEEIRKIKS
jgi:tetratricopeptide (TPR) repeat protein